MPLNVTHGYSNEGLCYTKGKPCIGDCIGCCCCQFKCSLRAHFSTCLTLPFLLRKMTFTKKCFWQGDLDNWLPFRVEEKSGLWSLLTVLSESWWIRQLCPLWCARYLCFPVSYILVVLSIGHLYVLHRWICYILQNRFFSRLWLHIQTHNP